MTKKRYELIWDAVAGKKQIRALKDMPEHSVKKNQLGGWIDSEKKLPQDGTGWVEEGSTLSGTTVVEKGFIGGNSILQDCIVKIKVRIIGSKIIDCRFLESNNKTTHLWIGDSSLSRVDFSGNYLHLHKCKIKATKKCEISSGNHSWKNVKMNCDSIYAGHGNLSNMKTKIEDSEITCRTLRISNSDIQNVNLKAERDISLYDSNLSPLDKQAESGTTFEGEELQISKSMIQGAANLRGKLIVKKCELIGYPRIDVNARMTYLEMKDMASIITEGFGLNDKTESISKISLSGDEQLIIKH